MKKFVVGTIGFAVLVALAAPRGDKSDSADTASAAVEEDAWARAAREARAETPSLSTSVQAPRVAGNSASVVLDRQAGHYFASAEVNNRPIDFLVDTGASMVALTEADARRADVQFDKTRFAVIGTGASGPVRGQLVTIDRISLQGKTVSDVRGAVLEGADISLLGQSFLNEMREIEMRDGKMVIR